MPQKPVLYIPDRESGYRMAHGFGDKPLIERMGFEVVEEERSDRRYAWRIIRELAPNTHRLAGYKDWQQSKVYRAEYGLRTGQVFANPVEMQAYINEVWETLGLTSLGGRLNRPPKVQYQRSLSPRAVSSAHSLLNEISMSRGSWSHNKVVLLHEACHILCGNHENHGPMFARTLVDLLVKFVSPETGRDFLEACMTGRELTHFKYTSTKDGYEREKKTRRYVVEVASPRYGLARFGPRTGFMTGVPANVEQVSPFIRSALGF